MGFLIAGEFTPVKQQTKRCVLALIVPTKLFQSFDVFRVHALGWFVFVRIKNDVLENDF